MFVSMSLQNVLFLPLLFWAVYFRFQDNFLVSDSNWFPKLLVCILMHATANVLEICNTDRIILLYFKPILLILFSSRSPKELRNLFRKPYVQGRRLGAASGATAPGPALEGVPRFRPVSLSSYILR